MHWSKAHEARGTFRTQRQDKEKKKKKGEEEASVSGLHLGASLHSVWPSRERKKKKKSLQGSQTHLLMSGCLNGFSPTASCCLYKNPEQRFAPHQSRRAASPRSKSFVLAPRKFRGVRLSTKCIRLKHCHGGVIFANCDRGKTNSRQQ